MTPNLGPGLLSQVACLLEVTARKPGNVHRGRDFEDLNYLDFLLSAAAIASPLERARETGVGHAIFEAVEATRKVTSTNTNLGIILLLAPLSSLEEGEPWRPGIERVLEALTVEDAKLAYRAIRLANPSGLGDADQQDVGQEPTVTLRQAMILAADRDSIARQYATGYADVLAASVILKAEVEAGTSLEDAILIAFIATLIARPDTHIARKCGLELARETSRRAREILLNTDPETPLLKAMEPLDHWLRADGHARNPGATADLMAAAIYVSHQGRVHPASRGWLDQLTILPVKQGAHS